MATTTKQKLSAIRAQQLIDQAKHEISDMTNEISAAMLSKDQAKKDLWACLETAKIGSLEFEKPRKAMQDADTKISANGRMIADRWRKIREWERVAE